MYRPRFLRLLNPTIPRQSNLPVPPFLEKVENPRPMGEGRGSKGGRRSTSSPSEEGIPGSYRKWKGEGEGFRRDGGAEMEVDVEAAVLLVTEVLNEEAKRSVEEVK